MPDTFGFLLLASYCSECSLRLKNLCPLDISEDQKTGYCSECGNTYTPNEALWSIDLASIAVDALLEMGSPEVKEAIDRRMQAKANRRMKRN